MLLNWLLPCAWLCRASTPAHTANTHAFVCCFIVHVYVHLWSYIRACICNAGVGKTCLRNHINCSNVTRFGSGSVRVRFRSASVGFGFDSVRHRIGWGLIQFGFCSALARFGFDSVRLRPGSGPIRCAFGSVRCRFGSASDRFGSSSARLVIGSV